MKSYAVRIKACVIKTVEVSADNENDAIELAHELFSPALNTGEPEKYWEDAMAIMEIPYDAQLPQYESDEVIEEDDMGRVKHWEDI